MKYIDLNQLELITEDDFINALNECCRELENPLLNTESRKKYITDNEKAWSNIKYKLWILGHLKCWYSEVQLSLSLAQVEHFRPKKKMHGSLRPHHGYWWRAFDWSNYRIAHPNVNRRTTDFYSGKKVGKGCYFPLKVETNRAYTKNDESNEIPVLLDPTVRKDCNLICFDSTSGRVIASPQSDIDPDAEWKRRRANDTIDFYYLNEGTWNRRRREIMAAVKANCKLLTDAIGNDDKVAIDDCVEKIISQISIFSEFTSAAKQALRENLDSEIIAQIL